jgi:hypothetical protein
VKKQVVVVLVTLLICLEHIKFLIVASRGSSECESRRKKGDKGKSDNGEALMHLITHPNPPA